MKTKSRIFISILATGFLAIIPEEGSCQNSAVQWSSFSSGFGVATSSMTAVKSSAGEVFVGSSQQANSLVESGFLGAPLLRGPIAGVGEHPNLPLTFSLGQNYPNPFNPSTTIRYELAERAIVTLRIRNVLGQEVAMLVNEEKSAGAYEVRFDALNLSSGVYFYTLRANHFVQTRKFLLMK